MATTRIRAATFALPTSGSTVTYTIEDMGGLTPVAARFVAVREDVTGAQQADSSLMHGHCVSGTQRVVSTYAQDADSGFSSGRDAINDRCVYLLNGDGSASECELSFSSFAANSVTLTVNKAASGGFLVQVTLISCDAAEIVEATSSASAFGFVDVPVNQTPHIMEFLFPAKGFGASGATSVTADGQWGYALASYDGSTITQGGHWRYELDGGFAGSSANASSLYSTSRLIRQVRVNAGTGNGELRTGLVIFTITSALVRIYTIEIPAGLTFSMLALHFGESPTIDYGAALYSTPTSTGEELIPTSAKPQFAAWLGTYLTASETSFSSGVTGAFGFGTADIDGRGQFLGGRSEDGRSTSSESKSWAYDGPWAMRANGGALLVTGDYVGMESGGIRIDWTKVTGSARFYPYWWVEDDPLAVTEDTERRTRLGVATIAAECGVSAPAAAMGVAATSGELGVSQPAARLGVARNDPEMGEA